LKENGDMVTSNLAANRLTTMEIKVHPSQYERPKRRPVRKSLGRQEPNFGQNISHLIWSENNVSLKHS